MHASLRLVPACNGAASVRSGEFREGRAADCTARLGRVRSGAPGSRSKSGHSIPEGQKEVTDVHNMSDREQDPDGTIQ